MKTYSFSLFNEVFFLSDFLLIPINDVLLLNQPWSFKPFFNPLVKAPIKKNPINNQINLSKNIKGEKAWPDLTISVRGSKGSKWLYRYLNIYNIYLKNNNFTKHNVLVKKFIKINNL